MFTKEKLYEILEGCRKNKRDCQKKLYKLYYDHALSVSWCYAHNISLIKDLVNAGF